MKASPRYRRLLWLHPSGPDREELHATLLDIHADGATGPTWRAQLGIVVLCVQRTNRIASRGRQVAFASVAILCLALPWGVHEHSPGFAPSHLFMPATVVVLLALVGTSYLLSTRRWSAPTRDRLDKKAP